jgi:tetratricopeptide (TPR) repeat protein
MATAQQTTNPIRLLMLGLDVKESLDKALKLDPDNVQVRLDLVRFHVTSPGIVGGSEDEARAQAAEIAKRDAPLGAFARGYIAYKAKKEYGAARRELRESVRTAKDGATKALAMRWLGWLSQETQQWDEAFAMFEELRDSYEIGRTSAFCACQTERGRAALQDYLRGSDRAHVDDAKKLLAKLTPSAPSTAVPQADAKPR